MVMVVVVVTLAIDGGGGVVVSVIAIAVARRWGVVVMLVFDSGRWGSSSLLSLLSDNTGRWGVG